jgi:hypothetical protein
MNPECRAGKHSNCDEKGWRDDLGHIGPCLCGCHEKTTPPVFLDYGGAAAPTPADFGITAGEYQCLRCDFSTAHLEEMKEHNKSHDLPQFRLPQESDYDADARWNAKRTR